MTQTFYILHFAFIIRQLRSPINTFLHNSNVFNCPMMVTLLSSIPSGELENVLSAIDKINRELIDRPTYKRCGVE
jgi:hypothetical protein